MADAKISALPASTTPLAGTELVPIVQGGVTKKVSVDNLTQGRTVYATTYVASASANIGPGGTSTGLGALYINGGSGGGGGVIQGQQNNSPTWLIGDTATALGSGTGMIEFIYGGAPKITWLQGTGEIHRTTTTGIVPASGKGINFTANTPAAGMTSQLLNWYEEGTWTPNQGSGLTVVGAFSSSGLYTRVGRLVTIEGTLSGATSIAVSQTGVLTDNAPYKPSSAVVGIGSAANSSINKSIGLAASSGGSIFATDLIAATSSIWFTVTYSI